MTQDKFYEVNGCDDRTRYFKSLVEAHRYCRDKIKSLDISKPKLATVEFEEFDFKRNTFQHYKPLGAYKLTITDPRDMDTFGLMVSYHITERKFN
jgi:hypothetical protein